MIEQLREINIFKIFSEEELKDLTSFVITETYKEGDIIFKDGEEGNSMYIIGEGEVEIKKQDKVLTLFTRGNAFGEMALFEDDQRSADAVSKSDTTLYRINNDDFKKFIFEHPDHGIQFIFNEVQEMSRRLRRTSEYLITVFETGRIIGGNYSLEEMTQKILNRLLEDIREATGGMIIILNPFTDMYDIASARNVIAVDLDKAVNLIGQNKGNCVYYECNDDVALGVPLKEKDKILGYIFIEKNGSEESFTTEQEIIITAVGNQVGMGILSAYGKQEEEARRRLEQSRMKDY